MRFLDKIKASEILPAAIGAVGVVYYALVAAAPPPGARPTSSQWLDGALQAHAPTPLPGSPSYNRQMSEWTKHVQTGQLLAVAALATGVLYTRFRRPTPTRP